MPVDLHLRVLALALEFAERCAERVSTHGKRRAEEMREAGEMVRDLGLDPSLCRGIADVQERGAKPR